MVYPWEPCFHKTCWLADLSKWSQSYLVEYDKQEKKSCINMVIYSIPLINLHVTYCGKGMWKTLWIYLHSYFCFFKTITCWLCVQGKLGNTFHPHYGEMCMQLNICNIHNTFIVYLYLTIKNNLIFTVLFLLYQLLNCYSSLWLARYLIVCIEHTSSLEYAKNKTMLEMGKSFEQIKKNKLQHD